MVDQPKTAPQPAYPPKQENTPEKTTPVISPTAPVPIVEPKKI